MPPPARRKLPFAVAVFAIMRVGREAWQPLYIDYCHPDARGQPATAVHDRLVSDGLLPPPAAAKAAPGGERLCTPSRNR